MEKKVEVEKTGFWWSVDDKMQRLSDYFNTKFWLWFTGIFLLIDFVDHMNAHLNYIWFEFHIPIMLHPSWLAVFVCGVPLAYLAISRLVKERFVSSALLITIAVIAALSIEEVFVAGEVAWIMALGAYLEDRAKARTRKGIEGLLKLVPQQGRKITQNPDGTYIDEMVDAKALKLGDIIRVLPGESIAADGKIISGETSVDQSIMTGESLPIDKAIGDAVFTGTINRFGSIDVEVTKDYQDSSLQKMINLVDEAEGKKAPLQKIVDKWAKVLVPVALGISILVFLGNYFVFDVELREAFVRGVTVLVVFCPCALVLATPVSVVAAIGQATKYGVLIKTGEALEFMGKITTVAFDKTGTLTKGNLVVSDVVSFGMEDEEMLLLAASAEGRSEHPLGKAIVDFAKKEKNVAVIDADDFTMTIGKGVTAKVNGRLIICGNEKLITDDNNVQIDGAVKTTIESLRTQGKAVVIISDEKSVIGILALSDTIKTESPKAINMLHDSGITKTLLLTGDNEKTANYIASQVGITDVQASLLPEGKVDVIASYIAEDKKICMVGDGVNDAPALKIASVGVAMGTMGSDIAIEAADVAIMGDDISKISYIKRLSNSCVNTIHFNIIMSIVINAVGIYGAATGLIGPVAGAILHNAGAVLVVLNATFLYDRKFTDMPSRMDEATRKQIKAARG